MNKQSNSTISNNVYGAHNKLQDPDIEDTSLLSGASEQSNSNTGVNAGKQNKFNNIISELEFLKKKNEILEKDLFKARTVNKKMESVVNKLQDKLSILGKNTNNTSNTFLLPSEFKTLWEQLVKDSIIEAFDSVSDDFYTLAYAVQLSMSIIYRQSDILICRILMNVMKTLQIEDEISSQKKMSDETKRQAFKNVYLPKLRNFIQEYYSTIFTCSEEFIDCVAEEIKSQYDEGLSKACEKFIENESKEVTEEMKALHIEMVVNKVKQRFTDVEADLETKYFRNYVSASFKLNIYILLHDPELSLNKMNVPDYRLFNKSECLSIEGFIKENSPCCIILNPPLLKNKFVYQGILPAIYMIQETSETIEKICSELALKSKKANHSSSLSEDPLASNRSNNTSENHCKLISNKRPTSVNTDKPADIPTSKKSGGSLNYNNATSQLAGNFDNSSPNTKNIPLKESGCNSKDFSNSINEDPSNNIKFIYDQINNQHFYSSNPTGIFAGTNQNNIANNYNNSKPSNFNNIMNNSNSGASKTTNTDRKAVNYKLASQYQKGTMNHIPVKFEVNQGEFLGKSMKQTQNNILSSNCISGEEEIGNVAYLKSLGNLNVNTGDKKEKQQSGASSEYLSKKENFRSNSQNFYEKSNCSSSLASSNQNSNFNTTLTNHLGNPKNQNKANYVSSNPITNQQPVLSSGSNYNKSFTNSTICTNLHQASGPPQSNLFKPQIFYNLQSNKITSNAAGNTSQLRSSPQRILNIRDHEESQYMKHGSGTIIQDSRNSAFPVTLTNSMHKELNHPSNFDQNEELISNNKTEESAALNYQNQPISARNIKPQDSSIAISSNLKLNDLPYALNVNTNNRNSETCTNPKKSMTTFPSKGKFVNSTSLLKSGSKAQSKGAKEKDTTTSTPIQQNRVNKNSTCNTQSNDHKRFSSKPKQQTENRLEDESPSHTTTNSIKQQKGPSSGLKHTTSVKQMKVEISQATNSKASVNNYLNIYGKTQKQPNLANSSERRITTDTNTNSDGINSKQTSINIATKDINDYYKKINPTTNPSFNVTSKITQNNTVAPSKILGGKQLNHSNQNNSNSKINKSTNSTNNNFTSGIYSLNYSQQHNYSVKEFILTENEARLQAKAEEPDFNFLTKHEYDFPRKELFSSDTELLTNKASYSNIIQINQQSSGGSKAHEIKNKIEKYYSQIVSHNNCSPKALNSGIQFQQSTSQPSNIEGRQLVFGFDRK